jgi:hypothetical protein
MERCKENSQNGRLNIKPAKIRTPYLNEAISLYLFFAILAGDLNLG